MADCYVEPYFPAIRLNQIRAAGTRAVPENLQPIAYTFSGAIIWIAVARRVKSCNSPVVIPDNKPGGLGKPRGSVDCPLVGMDPVSVAAEIRAQACASVIVTDTVTAIGNPSERAGVRSDAALDGDIGDRAFRITGVRVVVATGCHVAVEFTGAACWIIVSDLGENLGQTKTAAKQ